MNQKVKVAYIAGWGRSGSTLLDSVLGQTSGFFSGGELFRLWDYGLQRGGICGCGELLTECPVWTAIYQTAFGGLDKLDPQMLVDWHTQNVKTSSIPTVRNTLQTIENSQNPVLFLLDAFYCSIAETTDSAVIIDSSKHPMYGALLTLLPSVDVYLIHLVRHPNAVVFSWKRKKIMPDTNQHFRIRSAAETAFYWDVWNLGISYIQKRVGIKYLRVRYEDFIEFPQRSLQEIYDFLGESVAIMPVDHSRRFQMSVNHTVVGNPMKFKRGTIQLQLDSEWETGLSRGDKRTVSLLTWPLMAHYHYL